MSSTWRISPRSDESRERFRREVLPHLDSAYNYARYLCRDASASEDIVQAAFERAFRSIDQCRGEARPWLFSIVRNCFLDWRKDQSKHNHLVAIDGDIGLDVAEEVSGATIHDAIGLRETIQRLPEPFREALILRELEEMSYREMAAITRVPVGTIMSRLSRARQLLTALLFGNEHTFVRATEKRDR